MEWVSGDMSSISSYASDPLKYFVQVTLSLLASVSSSVKCFKSEMLLLLFLFLKIMRNSLFLDQRNNAHIPTHNNRKIHLEIISEDLVAWIGILLVRLAMIHVIHVL